MDSVLVVKIAGRRKKIKTRVLAALVILVLIGLGVVAKYAGPYLGFPETDIFFSGFLGPRVKVERILSGIDKDKDGIDDSDDIVRGARAEAKRKPKYKDAYYRGGYPPATEGVCTDVIWRAFKDAGYNLKEMVDRDIKNYPRSYPRVNGKPDPNIDFRRVPNLISFFQKNGQSLTTKVTPGDPKNLALWQGGDIVVFGPQKQHIAVISDKRRADGVPLIIHNGGPWATEQDLLLLWPSRIQYHFRFPKS